MRLEIGSTRAFDDPSVDDIRRELALLGQGRLEFLILSRSDLDYLQTAEDEEGFVVEWQEGGLDNHWAAMTSDLELLAECFLAYLCEDRNFKTMFPFEKIEL